MFYWENEEYLKEIIKRNSNKSDVLMELGLNNFGGNFNTLTRYIKKYDIDIKHFKPKASTKKSTTKGVKYLNINDVLIENSPYVSISKLKCRLYKEGIKNRECELCGQDENWKGKTMSLILDHINGVPDDNRLENLRIVCANCNSTLPTHCRGNKGLDLNYVKYVKKNKKCGGINCEKMINSDSKTCVECYHKLKFIGSNDEINRNIKKAKYNLNLEVGKCECGNNIRNCSILCSKCIKIKRRKVERPPLEQLLKEVSDIGYSATGRKYEVSDNSIRKWIKQYQKQN